MTEAIETIGLTTGKGGQIYPYNPSWFDRLDLWLQRIPGPRWLFYVALWATLSLAWAATKWYDGSSSVGRFNPYHVAVAGIPCYIMAALRFLDRLAERSLESFRPVLAPDEGELRQLRYRLTTLPALPALLVSAAMAIVALVPGNQFSPDQLRILQFGTSTPATMVENLITTASAVLAGLFIYHTVHQLRVVNSIYDRHCRIDLLKLGPLYAFSRLTAFTAALPVPALYQLTVVTPHGISEEVTSSLYSLWTVFGLLGVITFVLPLLTAHRLLAREKEGMRARVADHMQPVLAELHKRAERKDYAAVEPTAAVKNLLDSLVTELNLISKVSTWPWDPETPRLLATALLLPVILLIIGQVLSRFLG